MTRMTRCACGRLHSIGRECSYCSRIRALAMFTLGFACVLGAAIVFRILSV
jgi:hypothetical protein